MSFLFLSVNIFFLSLSFCLFLSVFFCFFFYVPSFLTLHFCLFLFPPFCLFLFRLFISVSPWQALSKCSFLTLFFLAVDRFQYSLYFFLLSLYVCLSLTLHNFLCLSYLSISICLCRSYFLSLHLPLQYFHPKAFVSSLCIRLFSLSLPLVACFCLLLSLYFYI